MVVVEIDSIEGRRFPAGRRTQNVVGGASPIQAVNFSLGIVTLDPHGGQVPWHNHEQEEMYLILAGSAELCVGDEIGTINAGEAVSIPPLAYHQLTNVGDVPFKMIYCYGPAGLVSHWRQELDGTLPKAGIDAPPLPIGSQPQHTGIFEGDLR